MSSRMTACSRVPLFRRCYSHYQNVFITLSPSADQFWSCPAVVNLSPSHFGVNLRELSLSICNPLSFEQEACLHHSLSADLRQTAQIPFQSPFIHERCQMRDKMSGIPCRSRAVISPCSSDSETLSNKNGVHSPARMAACSLENVVILISQ